MNRNKILLVEDDNSFGYILKEYLNIHGYDVAWIKDGAAAIKDVREFKYDLCILDIMLPGADGYEVATALRAVEPDTPFIFLTAKSLKTDKLKGFKYGCDDFEVKPVDEELLLAKIKAMLNRQLLNKNDPGADSVHMIGKYKFSPSNQSVTIGNEGRTLTEKETALLNLLFNHRNRLIERKFILREIWGVADLFSRKSMDVFITRLRKYLSADPDIKIMNIHNKGFIFQVPESHKSV